MKKVAILGLFFLSNVAASNEDTESLYCKGQAKSTLVGVSVISNEDKTINITLDEKNELIDLGFKPCIGVLKSHQAKFTDKIISYECSSYQNTNLEGLVFYSANMNIDRLSGKLTFFHTNRSKNGNIQTYYSMECEKAFKKF